MFFDFCWFVWISFLFPQGINKTQHVNIRPLEFIDVFVQNCIGTVISVDHERHDGFSIVAGCVEKKFYYGCVNKSCLLFREFAQHLGDPSILKSIGLVQESQTFFESAANDGGLLLTQPDGCEAGGATEYGHGNFCLVFQSGY